MVTDLYHVSKSFGEKQILRGITLSVEKHEAMCIVGRSGTGKSVTLKLIIAPLKPEAGQVWIDGEDITRLEARGLSRVRRKMGFLFQNAALFDFLTLYENLALPLRRLTHKSEREIDEAIERVLRQVGLNGDRHKKPGELSGGIKNGPVWLALSYWNQKSFLSTSPAAGWTVSRPPKSTIFFSIRKGVRR